jgi:hypothetical protein
LEKWCKMTYMFNATRCCQNPKPKSHTHPLEKVFSRNMILLRNEGNCDNPHF